MTKSKKLTYAELQIALLEEIAQYEHIPLSDLLGLFLRKHEESRERILSALNDMHENGRWIRTADFDADENRPEPPISNQTVNGLTIRITETGKDFLENRRSRQTNISRLPTNAQTPPKPVKGYRRTRRVKSINEIVQKEEQRIKPPKSEKEAHSEIGKAIAGRRGQHEFREALLEAYKRKCLVTECDAEAVLEAAHIKPYSENGDFEVANGLLLRADIHTLFDLGWIVIDTDANPMRVMTAKELENTIYDKLNGSTLIFQLGATGFPDKSALETHRKAAESRGLIFTLSSQKK